MDWKKHRLLVGLVVLAGLVIAVFLLTQSSQEQVVDDITEEQPEQELPEIAADEVDELEIRRPEAEPIVVAREGEHWKVTAPLEAVADDSTVSTALDKLSGLEVSGVAATKKANHERLEVDDASGTHVILKKGGEPVAHFILGAYKGGNTMVRLEGEETVLSVRGSIKYAFNKELKSWRDRQILDLDADAVQRISFQNAEHPFEFVRGEDGEWKGVEGQEEIERFSSAKVQSVVSSLAGMAASDFAGEDVTPAEAGFAPKADAGAEAAGPDIVTLWVAEGGEKTTTDGGTASADGGAAAAAETEKVVLLIGGEVEGKGQYYLQREGGDLVYVVSKYLADRLRPDVDKFQKPEPGEAPAKAPGGAKMKMPGKMMQPGGGGGQKIPPHIMKKIQKQLRQKQMQGGGQ